MKITNNTNRDVSTLTKTLESFVPYAQKRLEYDKPFQIVFESDEENSKNIFGKTAYYDPATMNVHVYSDGRHDKDMLRSISHEMVHHAQNCRGDFEGVFEMGEGYAQKSPHLRNMEAEAYLLGNGFLVRDFEDACKMGNKLVQEWKKENKMLIKEVTKKPFLKTTEKTVGIKKPEAVTAATAGTQTAITGAEGGKIAGPKKGLEGTELEKAQEEIIKAETSKMLSSVKTALSRMIKKSGEDLKKIQDVEAKLTTGSKVKLVASVVHLIGIDSDEWSQIKQKVEKVLAGKPKINEDNIGVEKMSELQEKKKEEKTPKIKVKDAEVELEADLEIEIEAEIEVEKTVKEHYKTKNEKLYKELMRRFVKKGNK